MNRAVSIEAEQINLNGTDVAEFEYNISEASPVEVNKINQSDRAAN